MDLWKKQQKKLTQITTEEGRWYEDSKKKKYYSVTTVLDAQKSPQDIIALEQYKEKEIAAGRDPKQAALDGTELHRLIEEYLLGDYELPDFEKDRPHKLFKQYYEGFLKPVHVVPHLIEKQLYTSINNFGYAGTVDLVATIQTEPEGPEELVLIDHKSIKYTSQINWKVKKHLLQSAAYAKAVKDRYGKEIDKIVINYASTTKFESRVFEKEEIVKAWNNFYLYYLKKFYEEGHDNRLQEAQ